MIPCYANPHKYRRGPGGTKYVGEADPYIVLKFAGEPDHVLWHGKILYDNGEEIEDKPPQWVETAIARLTDEGRKKVGF